MKKIIALIAFVGIGVAVILLQPKESIIGELGLSGMSNKELIRHFEYEATANLDVAITSEHLVVMADNREEKISLKDDDFYLSVAPYVYNTHPCDNHVPTGCQGDMPLVKFDVKAVGTDGTVYYDGSVVSADNGFFGLWLPRDKEIMLYVNGLSGSSVTSVSTFKESPTCLTTMRLT